MINNLKTNINKGYFLEKRLLKQINIQINLYI